MARQWEEVTAITSTPSIRDECVRSFHAVSKYLTPINFSQVELYERLKESVFHQNVPEFPRPTHPNGQQDDTLSMFRLWRYFDDHAGTLFTVALDRTIRRRKVGSKYKPHRNHWCVSIGISAANDLDASQIYPEVKGLLKNGIPANYRLALVWEARMPTVQQELNLPALNDPQPYPAMQIVDQLADLMLQDVDIKFYTVPANINGPPTQILPEQLLASQATELAYNHFKDHIEEHLPVGAQALIRSVEFKIH